MIHEFSQNRELKKTSNENNLVNEKYHNDVNVMHLAKSQSDEESSKVPESQSNESSPVNELIIDEKQYTKMRIKAFLFITSLLTIMIIMIVYLSKYYNYLYEIIVNPESPPISVALSGYLLLPVMGVRSLLIVLILFGCLYAFGFIDDNNNIQNTNLANDLSPFPTQDS